MATSNGYSAAEMKEAEIAWHNAQPMNAECAIQGCSWKLNGNAEEVLEAQKEHRLKHGFQKIRSRRSVRSLTTFKQNDLTEDDLTEIETERRRRATLTGVNLETETRRE